jgi:adenine-specific DNA-methyltransferase
MIASRLLSNNMARKTSKTSAKREAEQQEQPSSTAISRVRPTAVNITAAKGRPMLTWVGKRPLTQATAFPAQLAERHLAQDILGLAGDDPDVYKRRMEMFRNLRDHCNADCWEDLPNHVAAPESGGLLLHGDNKECLAWLLANGYRGKVDLVYIDPPFDSAADYVRSVSLRGSSGSAQIGGGEYSLGEQIQYTDIWANDNYLQFMYERLILLKELMTEGASLWLHCDYHRSHQLRCVLDEVFGAKKLQNEVIWQRTDPHNDARTRMGWVHDTLLWYFKGEKALYNWEAVADHLSEAALREYSLVKRRDGSIVPYDPEMPSEGRRFKLDDCTWKGRDASRQFTWRGATPSDKRIWPYETSELMDEALARGEFYLRDPEKGAARCRVSFLDQREGQVLQTIWTECGRMKGGVDYPTEKPEALLDRIIRASSRSGAIVLDCFIGSGTTAAVAHKIGRRWIGCDINKGAIQTTAKRVRGIVAVQIKAAMTAKRDKAGRLIPEPDGDEAKPCQFGFHVVRVNDYDLQIQHNEAVNLACEHIGVQRTRSDSFFDGTRGTKLVKIIPFDHPLSPVDLEEVRKELEARPDEDRGITMVCLGMEVAARTWIDDWNRRRGKAVNKIEVIELRTDPKYGRFIQHQPARARVKITRSKDQITVTIQDFVSPTIVERLQQQAGVVSPKIDDWRAMVDCVMIDTAYKGDVFNVVLADIPERKQDYIQGSYDLPAPGADETLVAVKIIDMLGEEVVHTANV